MTEKKNNGKAEIISISYFLKRFLEKRNEQVKISFRVDIFAESVIAMSALNHKNKFFETCG